MVVEIYTVCPNSISRTVVTMIVVRTRQRGVSTGSRSDTLRDIIERPDYLTLKVPCPVRVSEHTQLILGSSQNRLEGIRRTSAALNRSAVNTRVSPTVGATWTSSA